MPQVPIEVGLTKSWAKTVTETDIYVFGGIVGDLCRNHVNEQYMQTTPFGRRIAQGMLILSMSTNPSTVVAEMSPVPAVTLGYDRVRFLKPVFIGDTVTATYTVDKVDHEAARSFAQIEIRNQNDELCIVATHILKFIFE